MFTEPYWLVLLIPSMLALYAYRPYSRALFVLRALLVITLILAMSGLILLFPTSEGTIIALVDRSASMPPNTENLANEIIGILKKEMPAEAKLGIVSFGAEPKVDLAPSRSVFSGFTSQLNPEASNLNDALERSLSLIPSNGRILLLSDGLYSGKKPDAAAIRAAAKGIPIDYRIIERDLSRDLAITSFSAPGLLLPEEHFLIKTEIFSPIDQDAVGSLYESEKLIGNYRLSLSSGCNNFVFNMVAPKSSVVKYKIKIEPELSDEIVENNEAVTICEILGKKPVLLASEKTSSPMESLLKSAKIDYVAFLPSDVPWSIEGLAGYSAVILEDVSADKIQLHNMQILHGWIRHLGGGLLLVGGKNSFANGGYYQSPLDPALPVSMELRSEHRKMRLAVMIVLDRSGSMTAPTRGGRTKMDLANLSAAGVLDLLSGEDYLGVLAVDTEPHEVIPLSKVGDSKDKIRDKILTIESMGGGIYVYEGIKAAVEQLLENDAKTKHIILFADASDSEKPGEYWVLLDHATEAGITLSAIGLGTEADCDAEILKKVAKAGKGRIFFTREPTELPRLFMQDMFVAAKNTYIDVPVNVKPLDTIQKILPAYSPLKAAQKSIGAYNMCYPRAASTILVETVDENKVPIVSYWQYGLGKTACFATPLSGEDVIFGGSAFLSDRLSAQLLVSLCEKISTDDREEIAEMPIIQSIDKGSWNLSIYMDPEREKEIFVSEPVVELLRFDEQGQEKFETLKMFWDTADSISVSLPLRGNEVIVGTIKVDKYTKRLYPICQPYSSEYTHHSASMGAETLKQLADVSGGKEIINLSNIWKSVPVTLQQKDFTNPLLIIAILIFLCEIAERRLGLISMIFKYLKNKKRFKISISRSKKSEPSVKIKKPSAPSKRFELPSEAQNQSTEEKDKESSLSSAFKKAKNRADRRQ